MTHGIPGLPLCSALLALAALPASGTDWLQWRGPAGNGTSPESGWDPTSLQTPRMRWTAEVGTGHSAVVVQGPRLFTMGNHAFGGAEGEDVVVCLDVTTGEEVWAHVYPCAEKEDPGPCSTPLLADGRLYTLSREGHFFCLDAKSGEVLWMHHLVDEGLTGRHDYFATSPVACGEHVLLNLNRAGIAFDGRTGKVAWNSALAPEGFATPVVFASRGEKLVAMQRMDEMHAVEPDTGKVRWTLARGGISDPLFLGEDVVMLDFRGMARYRLAEKGPELLWRNPESESDFQSHVVVGDHVYGFGRDGGVAVLQCRSLASGALAWNTTIEQGALIAAAGKLIVVDRTGKLIIADASPEAFHELSATQAIELAPPVDDAQGHRREHACWTHPVLSHGSLYVRSTYGILVSFDVK